MTNHDQSWAVPGPQLGRRRRFSAEEKRRFIDEAARPGETVSSVGRRYGLSVSLLFRWRRQLMGAVVERRAAAAPAADKKSDDLRRLRDQVRELQRLLGKKTLEAEMLREELRAVQGGTALQALGASRADGTA